MYGIYLKDNLLYYWKHYYKVMDPAWNIKVKLLIDMEQSAYN